MNIFIKDITKETLSDLDKICLHFLDKLENKTDYLEGIKKRNEWYSNMFDKYGPLAKVAYKDNIPAGMIQFIPRALEQVIDIQCVFVKDEFVGLGIGSLLLEETIKYLSCKKNYFNDSSPKALITWAFDIPGHVPQEKLFTKFGFIPSDSGRPLYLPIENKYKYTYKPDNSFKNKSSNKKATIILDTSCPFCIFTTNKYTNIFKDILPEIKLKTVNKFKDTTETKCLVDFCEFNQKEILTAFAKKDEIKKCIYEKQGK
ncbi:MAG: hypothetical protein A2381_13425 [Bdellovibrionales bacterium RIFOXYB1_FULL_37_110]|nr:MAG: hypothetical protein A2417_08085 [Bdellovibrionales bacterium RIFOXYC1_FULL_37_79]OFZ59446.1 MAG: hypothetical protein A2381_13425 [Bdellovibrionales bacterium RIFOXYB1_FULL_37_110]OFZ64293.1 MAG: hypothetical protein A2577_02550 [Bdellovibrionales bacterium RIFOXYD1_FULL_36_51]